MDMSFYERLHTVISASRDLVEDKTASIAPELFGRLKADGSLVKHGTRINWKGTLKKAAVDLWDRPENNPDNAPNLWGNLLYKDGYRIIPEVITVTTAFSNGEIGWWTDGVKYRSKKDNNVYTPAVRPEDWEVAE